VEVRVFDAERAAAVVFGLQAWGRFVSFFFLGGGPDGSVSGVMRTPLVSFT
jgi:hypothetical protein